MNKYSISQTAKILCLPKDTLRYYDKIGLVKPQRGKNKYRYYTDMDLLLMQYVEVMKSAGLSLKEISAILHDTLEHTDESRKNVLDILKNRLKELRNKILFYQEAELLMTRTIQSLNIMSCPNDMEQIDEMIKALYARRVPSKSDEKRIEGKQNEGYL